MGNHYDTNVTEYVKKLLAENEKLKAENKQLMGVCEERRLIINRQKRRINLLVERLREAKDD